MARIFGVILTDMILTCQQQRYRRMASAYGCGQKLGIVSVTAYRPIEVVQWYGTRL